MHDGHRLRATGAVLAARGGASSRGTTISDHGRGNIRRGCRLVIRDEVNQLKSVPAVYGQSASNGTHVHQRRKGDDGDAHIP